MKDRLLFVAVASAAFAIAPASALADASPSPSPAAAASPAASPTAKPSPTPTPGPPFSRMKWRAIGPATAGGRVAAVAGSATDPKLYYVGSAGGGVWKSANGGQTWDPVFEKQGVAAIGAIAIDPTDNDTVWVGTGEANPRNDVSYGDGVYKTTDGGDHWTNVGLKPTRFISRILVDPRNHNHVIVGALGDVFNDSEERGVYVTDDGGKTWKKTLYVGNESGASDLAMSTQDPNVVYAGIWKFQRRPWTFVSGGAEDGLYKSTDGGNTWTKLTGHGLPDGDTGRIGLAVAPSDGNRVYALIESKQGILWRSDDGGNNWTMVSKDTLVDQRPFYFSHIAVDPKKPDVVYGVSEALSKSTDGGKTFKEIAQGVHVDYHAIWIAPNDGTRIITGEDGGYGLTVDDGDNWFFSANLPIGQVYRVGLGSNNPYTVCGGLQDNNAWCGTSNSLDPSGIQNKAWLNVVGGDGEWSIPDPNDPNWIWTDSQDGSLQVTNLATGDGWSAAPYIADSKEGFDSSVARYRFNWESPIGFAPWPVGISKGTVAWYGGSVIFQTMDRGRTWTVISPDLTRNIKEHQTPSGGPITHDVSGAEYSDTILDIEGSTLSKGEIWVGTDDGLVQLTRDYGKHWSNVTPPGAPEFGRFATVAPSTIVPGTAYAINDGHYVGDYSPYAWVTHDYGKTWTAIVNGLPKDQWARAIRPDIHDRSIVYLGTEEGMWISFDGGANWQSFQNDLPTVSVHDIRMQPQQNDLVIATHGRSIYIMDDMAPIQGLMHAVAAGEALFPVRTNYQWSLRGNDEGTYTNYAADNPPLGAIITFYQKEPQPDKNPPKIEILDAHGIPVRTVSGTHKVGGKEVPRISNKAGLNRWIWDWQIDGPVKWTGAAKERYQGPDEGAFMPPGTYSVRLTLGSRTFVQRFVVKNDVRSIVPDSELIQASNLGRKVQAQFSTVDTMLNNLDTVKKGLDAASDAAKKAGNTALTTQLQSAEDARKTLFDSLTANYQNDEDSIQLPGALREDVQSAFFAAQNVPTKAGDEFVARVGGYVRAAVDRYNGFVNNVLPGVNAALKAANIKTLDNVTVVKMP